MRSWAARSAAAESAIAVLLLEVIEIDLPTRRSSRYLSQFKRFDAELLESLHLAYDDHYDNEFILITNLNNEPKSYKEAISVPEKDKWLQAMAEELAELQSQETWQLTNLPKGRVALGGRWVYTIKTDQNGQAVRYKAR